MELLYVWVEEYGNIRKQGFNFSPNYDFDVKEENGEYTLVDNFEEAKKKGDFKYQPKNFFGENISNVTAIVGKNGCGKSTLIKALIKKYERESSLNFDLFESNLIGIGYYYDEKGKSPQETDEDYKKNIKIVYYDNFFSSKIKTDVIEDKNDNLINISNEYEKNKFDTKYISEEIKKQITFFKSEELIEFERKLISENKGWIKTPKKLKLMIDSKLRMNETTKPIVEIEKSLKIMATNKFSFNDIGNEKLDNYFYIFLELEFIKKILETKGYEKLIEKINTFKEIKELYNEHLKELKKYIILNQSEKLIKEKTSNKGKTSNVGIRPKKLNKKEDFMEKIAKWRKELSEIIEGEVGVKEEYENCLKKLKELNGIVLSDGNDIYLEIYDNFFDKLSCFIEENEKNDIFYYSWEGLSTGEETLLSMYSRLYSIKNNIDEHCLILLDEPENYLHPEWQRNLIKSLVEFINNIYKDKKIKFQIILTSHSPFVASDLPRENVIMLDVYDEKNEETKKDEEDPKYQKVGNCKVVKDKADKPIKTFGANIFDLYSDAFFVESSFGEFTKGKIKEVVKDLTSNEEGEYSDLSKERISEIEYILSSIGETLVKNKLQKMYDEYRNHKNSGEYKNEQLRKLRETLGLTKGDFEKFISGEFK